MRCDDSENCCGVEIPPSVIDSKKSTKELNDEVNALIDLALLGNKEAAKHAQKLARQILRRERKK
jgi:hypothetical protein